MQEVTLLNWRMKERLGEMTNCSKIKLRADN